MLIKNQSTAQSTKQLGTIGYKQLLQDSFQDGAIFKSRSQSNATEHVTPKQSVRMFQFNRQRGQSKMSEFGSQKTLKVSQVRGSSLKLRSSQINRDDIMKSLEDQIRHQCDYHEKLVGMFELDQNMKMQLQINHLVLEDKHNQPKISSQHLKEDIYIMVHNTIDRLLQSVQLQQSFLRRAQKKTGLEIINQFQEMVHLILSALSKSDNQLAVMIENIWKLLMLAVEFLNQSHKAECDNISQNLLQELKDQVQEQSKEIQSLNQKCHNLRVEIKQLKEQHKQEIHSYQYQVNVAKAEYNDFKTIQEQLSTFDNAYGCMKDVDRNIRETNNVLSKIEDTVHTRDKEFFSSFKSVITQYKLDRDSELNQIQRLQREYKFQQLQPKYLAVLQDYFTHPFLPYLMKPSQMDDNKDISKIFIEWFHYECQNKPNQQQTPLQISLRNIKFLQLRTPSELFIEYLIETNQIQYLETILLFLKNQTENMGDINLLPKAEKQTKQFYYLFQIILQMEATQFMTIEFFSKLIVFYQELQMIQSMEDEQTAKKWENKFGWYSFITQNLSQCLSYITDDPDRIQQQQNNITQMVLQAIQIENEKMRTINKKIQEENQTLDNETDINKQKMKIDKLKSSILQQYPYPFNQEKVYLILLQLFERNLKLAQKQKNKRKQCLEGNEWTNYLAEAINLMTSLIILCPQCLMKADLSEDLMVIEREIKLLRSNASSPEKKTNPLQKLASEIIQQGRKN
ncbi:hypothetical protein pb186bvf_015547 [Paramecium bursaria]